MEINRTPLRRDDERAATSGRACHDGRLVFPWWRGCGWAARIGTMFQSSLGRARQLLSLSRPASHSRVWSMKRIGLGASTVSRRFASTLQQGSVSPVRSVPQHIARPPHFSPDIDLHSTTNIKTPEEIDRMRESCALAAKVLAYAVSLVKPGITTDEIDRKTHEFIVKHNAYPSPLNYKGFPKSICTSINECVCHGIPDDRVLEDGDMMNIDVSVYLNGFHGDTSTTVAVGTISDDDRKLMQATRECLRVAIDACEDGKHFAKLGLLIEGEAANHGYGVFEDFMGHGIGRQFHEAPLVPHTADDRTAVPVPWKMEAGMTFTIEPILCAGDVNGWEQWGDGWTIISRDRSRSAQYEHTILLTSDGPEILTLPPNGEFTA